MARRAGAGAVGGSLSRCRGGSGGVGRLGSCFGGGLGSLTLLLGQRVVQLLVPRGLGVQRGLARGDIGGCCCALAAAASASVFACSAAALAGVRRRPGRCGGGLGGERGVERLLGVGGDPVERADLIEEVLCRIGGQQHRHLAQPGTAEAGVGERVDLAAVAGCGRVGLGGLLLGGAGGSGGGGDLLGGGCGSSGGGRLLVLLRDQHFLVQRAGAVGAVQLGLLGLVGGCGIVRVGHRRTAPRKAEAQGHGGTDDDTPGAPAGAPRRGRAQAKFSGRQGRRTFLLAAYRVS